jgi:hypothetical protein
MAQKRVRITRGQSSRLRQISRELDDYTTRVLLSGSGKRIMRPERLENLKAGRGKLQPWEAERLRLVQANQGKLGKLKEYREDDTFYGSRKNKLSKQTKDREVSRALRAVVVRGKKTNIPYEMQPETERRKQQKAIRALHFLIPDFGDYEDDRYPDYTYMKEPA